MRLLPLVWVLPAIAADPLAIVRKSIERDQMNWERAKDYTYISHSVFRERDNSGKVKKTEQESKEIMILFGEPHERLIEKDSKPLTADQQQREQVKIDRLVEKRQRETPAERQRRVEDWQKKRLKQREITVEIPEAYSFQLSGEETIAGRKTWRIDATPRPDYQPKSYKSAMLKKFKGRLWVDQTDFQWVRMEGEAIDTVTWGLFLARLAPGSRIEFQQIRVNDEVWMPQAFKVVMDARLALFKRLVGDVEVKYDSFRKFQADSRVLTAESN